MPKQQPPKKNDEGDTRRGQQAPNPMKSDVGRTDDVPHETAAGGASGTGMAGDSDSPSGSMTM